MSDLQEIDEALQGKMSADEEDAVQAELAALIVLQSPAQAESKEPAGVQLPDVPQVEPVEAETSLPEQETAPFRERSKEERELVPA